MKERKRERASKKKKQFIRYSLSFLFKSKIEESPSLSCWISIFYMFCFSLQLLDRLPSPGVPGGIECVGVFTFASYTAFFTSSRCTLSIHLVKLWKPISQKKSGSEVEGEKSNESECVCPPCATERAPGRRACVSLQVGCESVSFGHSKETLKFSLYYWSKQEKERKILEP